MPGSPDLPTKLKAWRKARDITQQQAAAEIGVALGTYRDWEQGVSSPRGFSLKALHDHIDAHSGKD